MKRYFILISLLFLAFCTYVCRAHVSESDAVEFIKEIIGGETIMFECPPATIGDIWIKIENVDNDGIVLTGCGNDLASCLWEDSKHKLLGEEPVLVLPTPSKEEIFHLKAFNANGETREASIEYKPDSLFDSVSKCNDKLNLTLVTDSKPGNMLKIISAPDGKLLWEGSLEAGIRNHVIPLIESNGKQLCVNYIQEGKCQTILIK